MGKNKSSKFFQGKEAFQRMNFLFQASEFVMSRLNRPSLAAYYGSQMTSICKKSVLRMEPSVKRQLCKGCRAPLVPSISSRIRINSSAKNMIITCLQCGTIKRFPMKPGYRVWTETPEACVETLTTRNMEKTESVKLGKEDLTKRQGDGKKISQENKVENIVDGNGTINTNSSEITGVQNSERKSESILDIQSTEVALSKKSELVNENEQLNMEIESVDNPGNC